MFTGQRPTPATPFSISFSPVAVSGDGNCKAPNYMLDKSSHGPCSASAFTT